MKIYFLGTNGWYSSNLGLTPSILVDSEEMYLVLDAGEGIHKIDDLIRDHRKPINLFLSHFHLDHIIGLHTLSKFNFKQGLNIYGKKPLKNILKTFVNYPFTVELSALPYKVELNEIDEGSHDSPLKLHCMLLPHPDPSMGYRFEIEGKTVTYCTDTGYHENLHHLARDSDILILECAHGPGEKDPEWRHLNPSEAAEVASNSNAKKLFLTHFSANRYTTEQKRYKAEEIARNFFKETTAAFDDMVHTC